MSEALKPASKGPRVWASTRQSLERHDLEWPEEDAAPGGEGA